MTWGFPAAVWFLLAIPAVIALYFLKRRRREFTVSSTLLWKRALEDDRVDSPFQRFRRNLLLLAQILALLALIAALAQPSFETENVPGRIHILCIDVSASMGTNEDGGTRLDLAKRLAKARVEALGADERAVIVEFGRSADAMTAVLDDPDFLQRAIDGLEVRDTTTRIDDALGLAVSLSRSASRAAVADLDVDAIAVVYSDGNFEPYRGDTLPFPIDFVRVGERTENVGIIALSAREDFSDPDRVRVYAELLNAGGADASGVLSLERNGEEIRAAESGSIRSGSRWTRSFEVPAVPGTITLRWTDETGGDTGDALAADNVASVDIPVPERVRVVIVGIGSNHFLDAALDPDVFPGATVERVSVTDLESMDPEPDVIVWDRVAPKSLSARSGHLMLDVTPPGLWENVDTVDLPPVVAWDPRHPVNRFIDYRSLSGGISKARALNRIAESIPIVETTDGALISEFELDGARGIVVGFDPLDSIWPLELSWSFFVFNAVEYLARASASEFRSVRVGELVEFALPTGVTEVVRTTPRGEPGTIDIDGGVARFIANRGLGLERLSFQIGETPIEAVVPVNLLSATESSIAPQETIDISGSEVEAGDPRGIVTRNLAGFAMALLLVLLVGEWWLDHRS